VFGDLDAETLRHLKKINLAPSRTKGVPLTKALEQRRRVLSPGTTLIREWNCLGRHHLRQPIEDRPGYYRQQVERSAIFWPAR
jgi:hypothetical protein